MKIQLKNIGPIDDAELELGLFSILCGKNNTGKTYVTYLLYCFLDYWNREYEILLPKDFVEKISSIGNASIDLFDIKKRANEILKAASKTFSTPSILSRVFAANSARFENSSILISLEQDEIDFCEPVSRQEFTSGKGDSGPLRC